MNGMKISEAEPAKSPAAIVEISAVCPCIGLRHEKKLNVAE
jgi:hypothetical protein